ncbi:MAG TPA: hypothetical protein VGN52_25110 [Burkholderiales bacterium]
MSYDTIESLLWGTRHSRCPAGSVASAGKRCAPGQGDAGVCTVPGLGMRVTRHAGGRPPRALRRVNKPVRTVCRVWWETRPEPDLSQA